MSTFEEQQLKKLESALAALTPRPAAVDRDQVLFEAGRRSVRTHSVWRWSTFGTAALAVLLVVALLSRPQREVQLVHVPGPVQPPVAGNALLVPEIGVPDDELTLPSSSYGRMRQAALSVGVEHMPMADVEAAGSEHANREPIPAVGARGVLETLRIMGDN